MCQSLQNNAPPYNEYGNIPTYSLHTMRGGTGAKWDVGFPTVLLLGSSSVGGGALFCNDGTWAGTTFWNAPGGVPTSASWQGLSMRWQRPWPPPANLCHKQLTWGQAKMSDREVKPHQLHLTSSQRQRSRVWTFPERVSAE